MNANAFRHFCDYHFTENRKLWDSYVTPISQLLDFRLSDEERCQYEAMCAV